MIQNTRSDLYYALKIIYYGIIITFIIFSESIFIYASNDKEQDTAFPSYFIDRTIDSGIGFTGYLGHTTSWADYNNDGCTDLFISNTDAGSYNNTYLFENTCSGFFYKIKNILDNNGNHPVRTSNWADLDNDGDLDLILGGIDVYKSPFVYKNNDGLNFDEVSDLLNIDQPGAVNNISITDYDNDGFLDIFESTFHSYLYRNNGKNLFEDTTFESGISAYIDKVRNAIFFDYNNDMFQDLVILYKGKIRLLHNNGDSTFSDVSSQAMLSLDKHYRPSGSCVGDYNNDGFLDLYIVNIGSPGNILFKNNGDGTFINATRRTRTSDVGDGRTCSFIDYNSDGFVDIFATNHINPSRMFKNLRNGQFKDVARKIGIQVPVDVFSATWGDYNGDAILDVFLNGHIGTALYEGFNTNNSVIIELIGDGKTVNTSAIGSRAQLKTENKNQIRYVLGGKGCCENDMLPLHFGLGQETAFSLTVTWTNGQTCNYNNLNAGEKRFYKVYQQECRIDSY